MASRGGALAAGLAAAALIAAPAAQADVPLMNADFCAGVPAQSVVTAPGGWRVEQQPNAPGITGTPQDRITIDPCPPSRGTLYSPNAPAMRVELRPYDDPTTAELADGDVNPNAGGTSRAEVYGTFPSTPASGTPWSGWPLATNGGEHWISTSVYLPPDWAFSSTQWLDLMQLKGYKGGSPLLAFAIDGYRFKLAGTRNVFLSPATRGVWHDIQIHARFTPDTALSGIEIWIDGVQVLPWTSAKTMEYVSGVLDPIYLKQGIYRTKSWTATHVAWFGPTIVT